MDMESYKRAKKYTNGKINNLIETGKNLLNLDAVVVGYINNDGSINDTATTLYTSDYIPVTTGFAYTSKYTRKLCVFDKNKQVIDYVDNTSADTYSYTPTEDGYIRVSFYCDLADAMQIEVGNTATVTEPYHNKFADSNNPLTGKILLNLGDSIAYGANNSGVGYADMISSNNDMTVYDYSQSGATIANVTATDPTRACVQLKLDSFITDNPDVTPDYLLLEGGSNDILYSPLGAKTSGYEDVWNTTEFCGGLETIMKSLKDNFPTSKVIFVCVHKNSSRDAVEQQTFYDATVDILGKWSIPFVDLYNEGVLNSFNNTMKSAFTDTGTHPNEDGYRLFYIPQIEKKMKSI